MTARYPARDAPVTCRPGNRVLDVSAAGYSAAKNSLLLINATTPPSNRGIHPEDKIQHSPLYPPIMSYTLNLTYYTVRLHQIIAFLFHCPLFMLHTLGKVW
jgi:hypothetical protein